MKYSKKWNKLSKHVYQVIGYLNCWSILCLTGHDIKSDEGPKFSIDDDVLFCKKYRQINK